MKDELIKIETALLAKEKGFKDITFNKRASNGELYEIDDFPTQSLLQKWIREVHNIYIYVEPFWDSLEHALNEKSKPEFVGWWIDETIGESEPAEYHSTYEQALEQALIEALQSIPSLPEKQ